MEAVQRCGTRDHFRTETLGCHQPMSVHCGQSNSCRFWINWRWRFHRAAEFDEIFSSAGLHIVPLQDCRTQGDGIMRGPHYTTYKSSADVHGLDGAQIWTLQSPHEICHGICSHQLTHIAHHVVVHRWQNLIISADAKH